MLLWCWVCCRRWDSRNSLRNVVSSIWKWNNFKYINPLVWIIRRCPGWFKWGFKKCFGTQDLIWYQNYVGIAKHWPSRALRDPPGHCRVPVAMHYNFDFINLPPRGPPPCQISSRSVQPFGFLENEQTNTPTLPFI